MRTASAEELCYEMQLPLERRTETVSSRDPEARRGRTSASSGRRGRPSDAAGSARRRPRARCSDTIARAQEVDPRSQSSGAILAWSKSALAAAVGRGVKVEALIAHTNRAGEGLLRKLELRLLAAGVTVSRTMDNLVRYHDKLLIMDERVLHVLAFNSRRRTRGEAGRWPWRHGSPGWSRKRQAVRRGRRQAAIRIWLADLVVSPSTRAPGWGRWSPRHGASCSSTIRVSSTPRWLRLRL